MGIMDNLFGKAAGAAGGGLEATVISVVIGMLGSKESGGLSAITESFTKNGLGDIVASWVGSGPNKAITPDQVLKGFGKERIGEIASKAGISPEQATSTLSKVMPDIVNKLTPGGSLPTDDLLQQGLKMFKG